MNSNNLHSGQLFKGLSQDQKVLIQDNVVRNYQKRQHLRVHTSHGIFGFCRFSLQQSHLPESALVGR